MQRLLTLKAKQETLQKITTKATATTATAATTTTTTKAFGTRYESVVRGTWYVTMERYSYIRT